MKPTLIAAAALLLALTGQASADTGNPNVKSIDSIAFGPAGKLLIADSAGAQIIAIQTGDTTPATRDFATIKNLKGEIGARLGTDAKGIDITRLAVNPASSTAYAAIKVLNGNKHVLVTIKPDGNIREFSLDSVNYTRYPVTAKNAKITDIAMAGDRIIIAMTGGETFASHIYSLMTGQPNKAPVLISTETFHVGHNKWETKAPIRTIMPYEEDGKQYLVGTFQCTPIVKYPLDEMKSGASVKGTSVIELGTGNTPVDMFTYKKDGKSYILVSNSRGGQNKTNPVGPSPFWVAKVDQKILTESELINEKARWRTKGGSKASESLTEHATVAKEYFGVRHMDRLNDQKALVARESGNDLELTALNLP